MIVDDYCVDQYINTVTQQYETNHIFMITFQVLQYIENKNVKAV